MPPERSGMTALRQAKERRREYSRQVATMGGSRPTAEMAIIVDQWEERDESESRQSSRTSMALAGRENP